MYKKDVIIERIILNKKAHQIFFTSNPGTKWLTKRTINAFIINIKNPRVRMVIGIVKNIKIGFKKIFKNPRTTATVRAVIKSLTTIPGRRNAVIKIARVFINNFPINSMPLLMLIYFY